MIKNIIFVIIFVVIIISILVIVCKKNKESFIVPSKNIDVALIFACYNIDLLDYNFINKYKNKIKIYVINSGNISEYGEKLKHDSEIMFITRENKGWDTTAWKEIIFKYYQKLSNYDLIILANNSCRYDFDLIKLCQQASFYDMFGLVRSREITEHLQTYFIIIHNHLFKTKDFQNYWKNIPEIRNRNDAIKYHELSFMKYFNDLGYKIGNYDNSGINVYGIQELDSDRNYYPEFVKKKILNPAFSIEDYERYIKSNFKF